MIDTAPQTSTLPQDLGTRGSFQRVASIGNEERIVFAAIRARASIANGRNAIGIVEPSGTTEGFAPTPSEPLLRFTPEKIDDSEAAKSNQVFPMWSTLKPTSSRPTSVLPVEADAKGVAKVVEVESAAADGFDVEEVFAEPKVTYHGLFWDPESEEKAKAAAVV